MSEVLTQVSELPTEQEASAELLAIVSQIRALPPRGQEFIRPAVGSRKEALARTTYDPNFDEHAWQQEWAKVEAEIHAIETQDATDDQNRNDMN